MVICRARSPNLLLEADPSIVADFLQLPSRVVTPNPCFEELFNAERQTQTLDAIIRSLHSVPMRSSKHSYEVAAREST
jgi:hypothetical protein